MNYHVVGRQVEVTEALKQYLDKKLSRLERYFSHIVDAKVVLTMESSPRVEKRAKVEIQVNLPRGMVRVEQAETDMYAAIDLAVERLEQSLKRYKERRLERHHAPEPSLSQEPEPQEEGQIVRVKRFPLRPMNPEDAAFEMEALGHDFYVFRNAKTEQINVIYRRRDGNYGLIEPE